MAITENLLSSIQQSITPEFIQKGSKFLGQNPDQMQSGLKAVIPTFLMGVIHRGSKPEGAQSLMNLIRSNHYDSGAPSNPADHLQNDESSERLLHKGSDAVSGVFGDQAPSVIHQLSSSTGMGTSVLSKMMAMVAPMVMGVLGSKAKQQGYDASAFSGFLGEQKNAVSGFLPAGLSGLSGLFGASTSKRPEVLDRGEVGEERYAKPVEGDGSSESMHRPSHEPRHRTSWIPLGLAALLAIGGFWYINNQHRVNEVARSTTQTVKDQAGQIASKTKEGAGDLKSDAQKKLDPTASNSTDSNVSHEQAGKAQPEVKAPADSMKAFLDTGPDSELPKRFSFGNLTFESGTAQLTPQAQPILDQIADALKTHPTARADLQGFADGSGNPDTNQALSMNRAKAVRQALINRKVNPDQIKSVGMGTSRPVGSNELEEGRRMNRRTDIIIVQR